MGWICIDSRSPSTRWRRSPGEVWRGRVWQPDRERFRRWLRDDVAGRADGQPVAMAVEGCTGWRYVVEEIVAAGFEAHVAEPADTQAARGRKRRAKTDRSDARLLRELLQHGELPESWIPPTVVLEWRERVRLYKSLVDQRTGVDAADPRRVVPARRRRARRRRSARRRPASLLADDDVELDAGGPAADAGRLRDDRRHRRRGAAVEGATCNASVIASRRCRALVDSQYGIGGLMAVAVWSELGDCRRFSRSEQVVRHTGLDVTVDASDRRRAGGYLSRQGPPTLRWALFEAAHERLAPAQPRPRLLHRR